MQPLSPVERDRLLERKPEEIEIGLVGERARAVELGDPDRDGGAVRYQTEALLAFSQELFLRQHPLGDIDMCADQPERAAGGVPFDFRDDIDPSGLTVARPHDAVFRRIIFALAGEGVEEML